MEQKNLCDDCIHHWEYTGDYIPKGKRPSDLGDKVMQSFAKCTFTSYPIDIPTFIKTCSKYSPNE